MTKGYKGLQRVRGGSQGVAGGCRGLQGLQRVTGG